MDNLKQAHTERQWEWCVQSRSQGAHGCEKNAKTRYASQPLHTAQTGTLVNVRRAEPNLSTGKSRASKTRCRYTVQHMWCRISAADAQSISHPTQGLTQAKPDLRHDSGVQTHAHKHKHAHTCTGLAISLTPDGQGGRSAGSPTGITVVHPSLNLSTKPSSSCSPSAVILGPTLWWLDNEDIDK